MLEDQNQNPSPENNNENPGAGTPSGAPNPEGQTPPSYGQQPYWQGTPNPYPPYQQFPAPGKPPKKSKTWLIVLIISLVYLALLGVLIAGVWGGSVAGPTGNNGAETQDQTEAKNPNEPINGTEDANGKMNIKAPDYTGETLSAAEIYEQNVSSVVFVESTGTNSKSLGSGFVIDSKNGYILTNYHVVENGESFAVTFDSGDIYKAELIGGDEVNDIAVLRVQAPNLRNVTIGDSDKLQIGYDIAVIGNPLGELTNTLTKGVVSGLDRAINTGEYTIDTFQIDAAVNSGNSGGPAFDATGAVVGVVSAKYAATGVEGLGFCIPINDAMRIANDLVNYGYVKGRANFGITVSTSPGYIITYDQFGRRVVQETAEGAYIEEVAADSAAAKAGLKVGDIVTKLDGTRITSSSELINAKNRYKAGDEVVLEVYRNGETVKLTLVFDEYNP